MKRRWWKRRRKALSPDGLPITSLPAGFASSIGLYGLRGSYSAIYRTQPNVRTVVDFIADEVASVKLKVYQKFPTTPTLPSGRLEEEDHQMTRLLNHPAPGMARSRFWRETVADLFIHDIAFWQKVSQRGQVAALLRQPPTSLIAERDPVTQRIVRYRSTLGGILSLTDLVVFHGYDPELHDGNISPIETLRRILAEESAAGRNRENQWKNATRKDGVVERPLEAEWDEDQREAWRDDWEGIMTGESNAGRVALLEDGMTWKESAWSPQEMEYLNARKLTRQECAAAFRIDPRLVYATDASADKEIRTAFYVDRLAPLLTRLSEEVDVQLLPDFEPLDVTRHRFYSEFNLDEKLRGSFEEQAKILVMTTGRSITTPDESRARLNLPPAPDGQGEGLTIPLNVAIGGQASPMSPLETPGALPALGQTPGPGVIPRAASIAVSVTAEELVWLRGLIAGQKQEPAPEEPSPEEIAELRGLAVSFAEIIAKHYARQARTLRGLAGAIMKTRTPTVDDLWIDADRWDRELASDLPDFDEKISASINLDLRDRLIPDDLDRTFLEVAPDRAAEWGVRLARIVKEASHA